MSWLEDVVGLFDKLGGGSSSSSQSSSSTSTVVTVNPTILNNIDTGPIAQPLQNLVNALTLGSVTNAVAAERQAQAIEAGAAKLADAQGQNTKINELATLATWGGLAIAVFKLLK